MGANSLQNEDFAETRLEVGLIKNKLEHLEESILEMKVLTKESISEVQEMLRHQGQRVPMWVVIIVITPLYMMSIFLLLMSILVYTKF
jgi:hypothetical protein